VPLNKLLWTSSYAVFTGGAALVILAGCYGMIESSGWKWWTPPFVGLGVNALAVSFLSTLLAKLLVHVHVTGPDGRSHALHEVLFEALFAAWASPATASLAWAFANVLVWLAVMWPPFREGVRLTV
jgi:predicted acyltransferase